MRTVLVTGASTGIGRATAVRLAQGGWQVFAGVRRGEDGDALTGIDHGIVPVMLDVTEQASIDDALRFVAAHAHRHLDAVVNNAGIALGGPVEGLSIDEWRQQFDVNLFGQIAVTNAALPMLRATRGRLVFVSSNSGILSTPLLAPYCASKHALEAFGFALREELRPQGITVSMVLPGAISTDIWGKAKTTAAQLEANLTAEVQQRYAIPIERMKRTIETQAAAGIPADEVARAIESALTTSRPRPRYYVGRDAQSSAVLARLLPNRALAAVLRRLDIA